MKVDIACLRRIWRRIKKEVASMTELNVYIDMDGTLTEFKQVPLEALYEPGYFRSLKENKHVVEAALRLAEQGAKVTVLSCYLSDSPYARQEKEQWLREHLPGMPYILLPCGENKAEKISTQSGRPLCKRDVLIDDHSPNLIQWQKAGGRAVKMLNGINGAGQKWKGERIHYEEPHAVDLQIIG